MVAGSSTDAAVTTCRDWTLGDLAWHMVEVQDFWTHVIGTRPASPAEYVEPQRPPDIELAARLVEATAGLLGVLGDADPADAAWSWSAEQTVVFTIRRQSHEALIHHVDAVLATGSPMPGIAPEFAADGVDEMVEVFLSEIPGWATFARGEGVIELAATDTGDSWTMAFGQMTGTSPRSGKKYDLEALVMAEGESPDAGIAGRALDLDLWLWGRAGTAGPTVTGDSRLVERLREMVAESTQ